VTSKTLFARCAAYNRWANARLYAAVLALPDEAYRRDVGLFFKSLHGTLNHLLVADRVWLHRMTGKGDAPGRLDAILYESLHDLARARVAEDARLIETVAAYDDAALAGDLEFASLTGARFREPLAQVLHHLFNHQTHHRGQAHTGLSILTGEEPPALDVLVYDRGGAAPDLLALTT
jgi:uncharacterized damage-inducible protein DinB